MGRLIDADKLKIYLKEYLHYEHAIPWVDAQPTAYDVEKVVAELDRMRNDSFHKCDGGITYNAYTKAIEIVRKGGVE